jgi:type II secretory pathway component PulJ
LTQEIARLHAQIHRQAQVVAAAQHVHRMLTDALNCRYGGTFLPASEKEIRRWRDVLSGVLEC